jgi:hypothetical protein
MRERDRILNYDGGKAVLINNLRMSLSLSLFCYFFV